MAGYTKDFLVGAYLHRFCVAGIDTSKLVDIGYSTYDQLGRDEFRKRASVTPEACAEYAAWLKLSKDYPTTLGALSLR